MKELDLPGGCKALVDDEDFERVKHLPWRVQTGKGYVIATVYLHRLVMKAADGLTVDHTNSNKLDNQKSNLCQMSLQDNIRKRGPVPLGKTPPGRKTGKTSVFTGVCWDKNRWLVTLAGKYVGRFRDETEAARHYNAAFLARYGKTAWYRPT